jgi:hypothetical protein
MEETPAQLNWEQKKALARVEKYLTKIEHYNAGPSALRQVRRFWSKAQEVLAKEKGAST